MRKWKGDSNPGGPGGRTRKVPVNKPRGKTSHRAGGGGGGKKGGCAVTAIGLVGGIAVTLAGMAYGAVEVLGG